MIQYAIYKFKTKKEKVIFLLEKILDNIKKIVFILYYIKISRNLRNL